MPYHYKMQIGDTAGDLVCVDRQIIDGKHKYLMRCIKCGREKWMLYSTIRLEHGTTHKACGKGLKTLSPIFYSRWQNMRTRTNNPNYEHWNRYGGRGIKSDAFENFIDFYDAMYESFRKLADQIGENNTSLERIDFDKDYTPENCIWIPLNEQQKNSVKIVHFKAIFPDGHTETCKNVREFAIKHDLDSSTIRDCLNGRTKTHKGFKFERISK